MRLVSHRERRFRARDMLMWPLGSIDTNTIGTDYNMQWGIDGNITTRIPQSPESRRPCISRDARMREDPCLFRPTDARSTHISSSCIVLVLATPRTLIMQSQRRPQPYRSPTRLPNGRIKTLVVQQGPDPSTSVNVTITTYRARRTAIQRPQRHDPKPR